MKSHVERYIENNKYKSNVLLIKSWSLDALGLLLLKELLPITATTQTKMENEKKFIVKLFMKYIPNLLENVEPRVRKLCSEVLYLGAYQERINYLQSNLVDDLQSKEVEEDRFFIFHTVGLLLLSKIGGGTEQCSIDSVVKIRYMHLNE
jgi:hypothetical protein